MWDFFFKALGAGTRFGAVVLLGGTVLLAMEGWGLFELQVQGAPWARTAVVAATVLGGAAVAVGLLILLANGSRSLIGKWSAKHRGRAEERAVDTEALANVLILDDDERHYLVTLFRQERDRFSTDYWDDAIEGLSTKGIIAHPDHAGGNVWVVRPSVWAMRSRLADEWSYLPTAPPLGLMSRAARSANRRI